MIEVKHLTKKYGTHLAVDDLSFTIEKGRIYGFLGPNGAGKSTLMNVLSGIYPYVRMKEILFMMVRSVSLTLSKTVNIKEL